MGKIMASGAHSARVAPVSFEEPSCSDQVRPENGMELYCKFVVGYALTKEKIRSFIQPKLLSHAKNNNIYFVEIDRNIPLVKQGPFDAILHKFTGKEWRKELEDYASKCPDVIILDPPHAIQQLRNRQSMLKDVADLNLTVTGCRVGIPRQLVVVESSSSIPHLVKSAGLKLPLVAKPLVVDNTVESHAMILAQSECCLSQLKPPLVLQEFVNHGGILFKVYVIGEVIRVVRRLSVPDVSEESQKRGLIAIDRVSSAKSAPLADMLKETSEVPPEPLLRALAKELRQRLGLHLFNLDLIRKRNSINQFYIIDINYFPGYGKVPDYELLFTDFFVNLAVKKAKASSKGSLSLGVSGEDLS